VLVALTVTDGQPTRAAAVIGGSGFTGHPKARLRWWAGPDAAREFNPETAQNPLDGTGRVWLRVVVPPGARSATLNVAGHVVTALIEGVPADLRIPDRSERTTVSWPTPTDSALRELVVEVRPSARQWPDASVLRGPVHWQCGPGPVEPADWRHLGLGDFSGTVTYATAVELDAPARASLVLHGLVGTAAVTINGTPLPVAMLTSTDLPVGDFLRPGRNELVIEVANTLANYYGRVPSPYSAMQHPGGGFVAAEIRLTP